jgi:hypothetical protein
MIYIYIYIYIYTFFSQILIVCFGLQQLVKVHDHVCNLVSFLTKFNDWIHVSSLAKHETKEG